MTRIFKNKISRNVYIDNLDNIVDKYNNTYHTAIKMKPVDVKSNTYIYSNKEINCKDLKFKIGDIAKISKYFCKRLHSKLVRIFYKKIKSTFSSAYVINDLNREEVAGTFYKKEMQKAHQKDFRIKKVIKGKGNKLYVTWKGHNN